MNSFEVMEEHAVIFMNRKNGEIIPVKVDIDVIESLIARGTTWTPLWNKNTRNFYAQGHYRIDVNKKTKVYLHRIIMDAPKGMLVDHINNDTLDNRRSNMRLVTQSENQQNRKGAAINSRSGVLGVHWNKQRELWQAEICVRKKRIHIGFFEDIEDARKAYLASKAIHHIK